MNIKQLKDYYNTKPVEYIVKENIKLKEDTAYVPRFKLKDVRQIASVPINEPIKPTQELIVKSIKYGMIFLINYKGESDNHFAGHERVIYPLVIGKSTKGKLLVRGYHLNGWSVSSNRHLQKVWRMFRTDRIMSMSFTGTFFRLTPEGYNSLDKGMRGGITKSVNIDEVRNNQKKLAQEGAIQSKKSVTMDEKKGKVIVVETLNANSVLDLTNPLSNPNIEKDKDNLKMMRLTFLKSTTGDKGIAILGALGQKGNIVKISSSGKYLGEYTKIDHARVKDMETLVSKYGNRIPGFTYK